MGDLNTVEDEVPVGVLVLPIGAGQYLFRKRQVVQINVVTHVKPMGVLSQGRECGDAKHEGGAGSRSCERAWQPGRRACPGPEVPAEAPLAFLVDTAVLPKE